MILFTLLLCFFSSLLIAPENEVILNEMNVLKRQVLKLQKENEVSNRLKTVTMEMLQAEREETSTLKREINGYQDELRNCYKMIIELRKLVPKAVADNFKV